MERIVYSLKLNYKIFFKSIRNKRLNIKLFKNYLMNIFLKIIAEFKNFLYLINFLYINNLKL